MRNGGSCPSLRIIRIVFWSRRPRKAAKPMLKWRMRPSSGAGISSAIGLRRSASFSPGEPLEAARRAWLATPDRTKKQALLMGLALTQAQVWLGKRSDGMSKTDRDFIVLSRKTLRRQRLRGRTFIGFASVVLLPLLSVLGWMIYHVVPQFWDITTS